MRSPSGSASGNRACSEPSERPLWRFWPHAVAKVGRGWASYNRAFVAAGVGFAVSAIAGCGSSGRTAAIAVAVEPAERAAQPRHAGAGLGSVLRSAAIPDAISRTRVAKLGDVNSTLIANLNQGASTIQSLARRDVQDPDGDDAEEDAHEDEHVHHDDDLDADDGDLHEPDDDHLHTPTYTYTQPRPARPAPRADLGIGRPRAPVRHTTPSTTSPTVEPASGRHRHDRRRRPTPTRPSTTTGTSRERRLMNTASVINGRYRVEGRLGVGGMSTVLLALDERLERHVAVKLLAEHLADDPTFVSRFRREALSAARAGASQHRPGVRLGLRRVRASALHRDGVRARAVLRRDPPRPRPSGRRAGRRHRHPGLPRAWITRIATASCTATSSRATCWSPKAAWSSSPTSGSPAQPDSRASRRSARCWARRHTSRRSRRAARRPARRPTSTRSASSPISCCPGGSLRGELAGGAGAQAAARVADPAAAHQPAGADELWRRRWRSRSRSCPRSARGARSSCPS